MKARDPENLAERLRSLYQTYHCEAELPNDLAAKLDAVEPEVYEAIQFELGCDYIYPKSKEELREEEAKIPLYSRFMLLCALTVAGGGFYAEEKYDRENQKKGGVPFFLHAVYGALKSLPAITKGVFSKPDQKEVEEYNKEAAQIFKMLKNNVADFLQF